MQDDELCWRWMGDEVLPPVAAGCLELSDWGINESGTHPSYSPLSNEELLDACNIRLFDGEEELESILCPASCNSVMLEKGRACEGDGREYDLKDLAADMESHMGLLERQNTNGKDLCKEGKELEEEKADTWFGGGPDMPCLLRPARLELHGFDGEFLFADRDLESMDRELASLERGPLLDSSVFLPCSPKKSLQAVDLVLTTSDANVVEEGGLPSLFRVEGLKDLLYSEKENFWPPTGLTLCLDLHFEGRKRERVWEVNEDIGSEATGVEKPGMCGNKYLRRLHAALPSNELCMPSESGVQQAVRVEDGTPHAGGTSDTVDRLGHSSTSVFVEAQENNEVPSMTNVNKSLLSLLTPVVSPQRRFKLVLDLDFTVVHSMSGVTMSRKNELLASSHAYGWKGFKTIDTCCTKLRPGTSNLLQAVMERCEVSICTLGTQLYANEISRLHDPIGRILGNRIFSKRAGARMVEGIAVKDLNGICEEQDTASTLIVDDLRRVWPSHKENLINCVPYKFFDDTHGDYAHVPPLMDTQDEDEKTGPLSRVMEVILEVIRLSDEEGGGDVAHLLARVKRRVLDGLCIAIFGFNAVLTMKLSGLARVFGATVETVWTAPSVTHVIISQEVAKNEYWWTTRKPRKTFVTPAWLDLSARMYQKQAEELFTPQVKKQHSSAKPVLPPLWKPIPTRNIPISTTNIQRQNVRTYGAVFKPAQIRL